MLLPLLVLLNLVDLLVVVGAVDKAGGDVGGTSGKGGDLGIAGDLVGDGNAELLEVRDGGEAGIVRVVLGVGDAGASSSPSSLSSSMSSPSMWAFPVGSVSLASFRHLSGSYLRNFISYYKSI